MTSSAERQHIKSCGDTWHRALARATLAVRQDGRLTGLDHIRDPLAFQAALRATGLTTARYVLYVPPKGPPTDIADIVAQVFDRAVQAAAAAH